MYESINLGFLFSKQYFDREISFSTLRTRFPLALFVEIRPNQNSNTNQGVSTAVTDAPNSSKANRKDKQGRSSQSIIDNTPSIEAKTNTYDINFSGSNSNPNRHHRQQLHTWWVRQSFHQRLYLDMTSEIRTGSSPRSFPSIFPSWFRCAARFRSSSSWATR